MMAVHANTYNVGEGLTAKNLASISVGPPAWNLALDNVARTRVTACRAAVERALADPTNPTMYGINTGFADNRTHRLTSADTRSQLQVNLVRSHAAGMGPFVASEVVRAAIAIRAESLAKGYSGVRPELIDALCTLFNSGYIPAIPSIGSVGASGDLAPLSHLALVLLGEGHVLPTPALAGKTDITGAVPVRSIPDWPIRIELKEKEGLALNNGTALVAAWLALAAERVRLLIDAADLALAMTMFALGGIRHAFAPEVQALRPHPPTLRSTNRVLRLLADTDVCGPLSEGNHAPFDAIRARDGIDDRVQDDYSIRCAPSVHGSAARTLAMIDDILACELDSVTDNPLILPPGAEDWTTAAPDALPRVRSAGHFHAAPLAAPADYLRIALADLASVSERRIAKLVDRKRNHDLANYLVHEPAKAGLESGFMIVQYAAAGAVNELKTRAHPHSVDSIPTGNNAEDHVSMGAGAAKATWEASNLATTVIAGELLTAAQAALLRKRALKESNTPYKAAPAIEAIIDRLQAESIEDHQGPSPLVPVTHDTPMWTRIAAVENLLLSGKLLDLPQIRPALT